MKDFIEYLLTQIVSKPEEVKIEEEENEGFTNFKITVSENDMGLVIGKEGRTIKSIRALARAKAIRDNIRVNIELVEPTKTDAQN
jgi:predicted RNA-binding protein YlqC (UPF0109 family)